MSCWSDIEGTWSYKDMRGSRVKLKSVSLSYKGTINKNSAFRYAGMEMTIKDIYFRVSTDGKIIPLFRMEEVTGKLFLGRDLELIEISRTPSDPRVCGKFVTGPKNWAGENIDEEGSDNSSDDEETEVITTTTSTTTSSPELTTTTTTTTQIPDPEEEDPFDQNVDSWEIIIL